MTIIEYKGEMVVVDMGVLFADGDYPGVNYLIPDIKYLEDPHPAIAPARP